MANPIVHIPQQIRTIVKTDTTNFSTLTGRLVGSHGNIPMDYRKRLMEVIPLSSGVATTQETGFVWELITGFTRFTVIEASVLTWTSGDADVSELATVVGYVNAFVNLFSQTAYQHLSSPTIGTDGYMIMQFRVESPIEYAEPQPDNNYEWQAIIPWSCEIKKTRS